MSLSCRISVWDRATGSSADGLWEAAAAGKVNEDAFEVHNKAATWSSTTQSFELDLLEVMLNIVVLKPSKLHLAQNKISSTLYFDALMEPCEGNVLLLRS